MCHKSVEIVLAFFSKAENTVSVLLGLCQLLVDDVILISAYSVHVCVDKTTFCQYTVLGEV